eukprot:13845555-Heterocapsa_arctica.AAC.1
MWRRPGWRHGDARGATTRSSGSTTYACRADLLIQLDEGNEALYTTGMFAPPPYVDEPAAESHPATSARPAMSSSSRPRSPPPVRS